MAVCQKLQLAETVLLLWSDSISWPFLVFHLQSPKHFRESCQSPKSDPEHDSKKQHRNTSIVGSTQTPQTWQEPAMNLEIVYSYSIKDSVKKNKCAFETYFI